MIRRLLCLIGRHRYRHVGDERRDRVYRCERCGRRQVVLYTLRIDRLS
jgi:hypothetical protein